MKKGRSNASLFSFARRVTPPGLEHKHIPIGRGGCPIRLSKVKAACPHASAVAEMRFEGELAYPAVLLSIRRHGLDEILRASDSHIHLRNELLNVAFNGNHLSFESSDRLGIEVMLQE